MMDKAFESGKLTKDGFVNDDGKIDAGKFVSDDEESEMKKILI